MRIILHHHVPGVADIPHEYGEPGCVLAVQDTDTGQVCIPVNGVHLLLPDLRTAAQASGADTLIVEDADTKP